MSFCRGSKREQEHGRRRHEELARLTRLVGRTLTVREAVELIPKGWWSPQAWRDRHLLKHVRIDPPDDPPELGAELGRICFVWIDEVR